MQAKFELRQNLLTLLCLILAMQFAVTPASSNSGNRQETPSILLTNQQEILRNWLVNNSVIHFSLDKQKGVAKKYLVIIETKELVKLYQARSFAPIWTNQEFLPNKMVKIAQQYMQSGSLRHGLNVDDYLSFELKAISLIPSDSSNWMYNEIMMSHAFLRMGKDLATGRMNYSQLEKEFKLKQTPFKSFEYLQSAMNANTDAEFAAPMEKLAPASELYKKLVAVLEKLSGLELSPEWGTNINLDVDLKYGYKNINIPRVRQRLSDLGYTVELVSPIFDDNFMAAVKDYQSLNGLMVDGMINRKGSFIRALNKKLKNRIAQVKVNLERLRFLPRKMEAHYAFVNTAFAEFNLIENGISIMKFNTIVGKQTRRTPSKRDLIEQVVLNPSWIIPFSIFKKDKLEKIQLDMDYLKTRHIRVLDRNKVEYNPLDFDWNDVNPDKFLYELVQQPGFNNSLGVVKFPLHKHNDHIYLHDTNERLFFEPEFYNRHKSSGCVRLEKPLEFAEYILKSSTDNVWNLEKLKSLVPPNHPEEDLITYDIKTSKSLPIYMVYLTVGFGEQGQVRFSDDIYGQDSRFSKVLKSTNKVAELVNEPIPSVKQGSLVIVGEAGPTQLFSFIKAIPCKEVGGKVQKGSCQIDKAMLVPLNVESKLAYGPYILGFENSIYPGFIRISAKPQKIQLAKIQLANFESKLNSASYRVIRDFGEAIEKNKNPFQTYFVEQPIFSLAQYDFGGLYLRGSLQRDLSSRLSYRVCDSATKVHLLSEEAQTLCENAKVNNLVPTIDFFVTNRVNDQPDGTFTEKWINEDVMDVVEVKHPYHLVAAPLRYGEFVSVFPGAYRVIDEEGKTMLKVTTDLKEVPSEFNNLFKNYEEKSNDNSDRNEDQNI